MNKLINKYSDFEFNSEFPNLYMILLYESGGDFITYSRILNYENYEDFVNDYDEFVNLHESKFKPINPITYDN